MRSPFWGLFVLLAAAPAAAGPFCVVNNYGTNCNYFMADACYRAAQATNGMCVANQNAQQQLPQIQNYDIAGSIQRGYAEGQRRRMEQEAHQARMELIQAQAEAARAQAETPQNTAISTYYVCPAGDGRSYLATEYGSGCLPLPAGVNPR